MNPHRTILIAGPTASGKSALALALAERLGGVVINADSAQVYRELRILTARPTPADEARAPHRLYGHIAGRDPYSAARFAAEAGSAIAAAHADGITPIVVGGTGLYFKALLEGLAPIPAIPDHIRARWRTAAVQRGPAALHAELAQRDPETAARLHPTDPQRLARALEVHDATGRGLASWQREPGRPLVALADTVRLLAAPPRDDVLARADRRLDAMIAEGALDEVRDLAALDLPAELPIMRSLGAPPLMAALAGRISLEQAVAETRLDTRRYVKRQLTWLKRNMISWKTVNSQDMERICHGDFPLIQL